MKNTTRRWFAVSVLSTCTLASLAACSGKQLNLGGHDAGDNASPDAGGDAGAAATQKWTGYFESYMLPSGSDKIALALDFASDGAVTGAAVLGNLPLLAPATDPEVGYPPAVLDGGPPNPLEHFAFTLMQGRFDGARLTFGIKLNEVYTRWCEIQKTIYPIYNGGGMHELVGYGCLPNVATMNGTSGCTWHDDMANKDVPIDCNKLGLCLSGGPCQCTMTSCAANVMAGNSLTFDIALSRDTAAGTVRGLGGQNVTVHLTKMP